MVLRTVTHNNDKCRYSKKRFVFEEWRSVPEVPTEGREETMGWLIKGGADRNVTVTAAGHPRDRLVEHQSPLWDCPTAVTI